MFPLLEHVFTADFALYGYLMGVHVAIIAPAISGLGTAVSFLSTLVLLLLFLRRRGTQIQTNRDLERFRITFEKTAIGLAHVSSEGRFLLVNEYLCNLVGYAKEEFLGLDFADITHPDDVEQDRSYAKALLAGETETYSCQKRYVHKNGSVVWVALNVSLIRNRTGDPDYFLSAMKDISAEKEAQSRLEQTTAALEQREQDLQLVFETAELADWKWDIVSDQVSAHAIVMRQYGHPELVGPLPSSWFMERQHPDDREGVRVKLQEAIDQSTRFDLEFRVIFPDHSIRWLACRGTVVRDDEGQPLGTQGINLDVTDRKEAELAVRASESQLLLLTEVLPQILWFTAANGDAEFFNKRWYEYTGQTSDRALDWGWHRVIHPDDLDECLKRWRHALGSGDAYETEYRLRAADGTYRWHLARAIPLLDQSGQITRWFGSCTDVNDLKAAEATLRSFHDALEQRVAARTTELLAANHAAMEARLRLQSVLDSAIQVVITTVDNDGIFELFNRGAENLLLYSASEVVGQRTPSIFLSAEEIARRQEDARQRTGRMIGAEELFKASNLPSHPYSFETKYRRRDGAEVHASMSLAPIVDNLGRRAGTVGVAVDVSDRERLSSQLQRLNQELLEQSHQASDANRAKSQFLAAMSHEIRTPMNAILGIAELLGETDLDAKQRQYVEVFRRAGSTLLTLINDILDLSKIESGNFELENVDFDLEDLVERTMELIRPKARAKQIDVLTTIGPAVPNAFIGDPNRLQQILLNLMGNAVKFTESGSASLSITVSETEGAIHFDIHDTGIGIPANKLDTIFDDFKQAESSTTRRFGGTGLGLGISRRLIGRMGGELKVQSEVGKGSTFYFDVLLQAGQTGAVREEGTTAVLSGLRVLIVDNNRTNRLIFSDLCDGWGMHTTNCSRPHDALKLLGASDGSRNGFDVVLLDHRMPDMDGFEFALELKARSLDLPVVLITSDSVPGDETRAKKLGISGYAVKPVSRSELKRLMCVSMAHKQGNGGAASETNRELARDRGPRQILIAEDFEDNRFLLEAYLTGTEYALTFVANGQEAVEATANVNFDLVLMDVHMPVMDGLTATRLIRQKEATQRRKTIPILALTADAMAEDINASLSAGCNAHLCKPISKQKLLTTLKEYVGSPAQ